MSWSQLSLGFLVFIVAGLLIACAVYEGSLTAWTTGSLVLVLGVLTTVAALLKPRRRAVEPEASAEWNEAAAPPLGQMLLSYGVVSEEDLAGALEVQKTSKKRLGQVLVEMELVTEGQMVAVLEGQLSKREGRLLWGIGDKLLE